MRYDWGNKLLGVSKDRSRLIKQVEMEFRNKQIENEKMHYGEVLLSDFLCKNPHPKLFIPLSDLYGYDFTQYLNGYRW